MSLTKQQKQHILQTLNVATLRMIKQVQQGYLVSSNEFYHLCEGAYKNGVWLGSVKKLTYTYHDSHYPNIAIKIKFLDTTFTISFLWANHMVNLMIERPSLIIYV